MLLGHEPITGTKFVDSYGNLTNDGYSTVANVRPKTSNAKISFDYAKTVEPGDKVQMSLNFNCKEADHQTEFSDLKVSIKGYVQSTRSLEKEQHLSLVFNQYLKPSQTTDTIGAGECKSYSMEWEVPNHVVMDYEAEVPDSRIAYENQRSVQFHNQWHEEDHKKIAPSVVPHLNYYVQVTMNHHNFGTFARKFPMEMKAGGWCPVSPDLVNNTFGDPVEFYETKEHNEEGVLVKRVDISDSLSASVDIPKPNQQIVHIDFESAVPVPVEKLQMEIRWLHYHLCSNVCFPSTTFTKEEHMEKSVSESWFKEFENGAWIQVNKIKNSIIKRSASIDGLYEKRNWIKMGDKWRFRTSFTLPQEQGKTFHSCMLQSIFKVVIEFKVKNKTGLFSSTDSSVVLEVPVAVL